MSKKPQPAINVEIWYEFYAKDQNRYLVEKQYRQPYFNASSGTVEWWVWASREMGTVDEKTMLKIKKGQELA